MRRALLAAAVGAAALVAGTAQADTPVVPDDAVAVVAGEAIPLTEYTQLLQQISCSFRAQHKQVPQPGTPEAATLRDQIVAFLVQRVEHVQAATQLGIVVTDADVSARLQQLIREFFNGNVGKYEASLRAQCLTDALVQKDIRTQLVNERLYATVTASASVTDAEIRAYYATHRSQFRTPASRLVRHILVKQKALAERLYAELRNGASFTALARKYSLDPASRRNGGRFVVRKGETIRAFEHVAFALKTGALSRPFRTRFGWHVVQALSPVHAPKLAPFAKAAPGIRVQLLQQKRNELMRSWEQDLEAQYTGKVAYAPGYAPGSP